MNAEQLPRRIRLDRMTPAELAIREAMLAVEKAGAHPLLTDAIVLLGLALEKVADYVDRESVPSAGAPTENKTLLVTRVGAPAVSAGGNPTVAEQRTTRRTTVAGAVPVQGDDRSGKTQTDVTPAQAEELERRLREDAEAIAARGPNTLMSSRTPQVRRLVASAREAADCIDTLSTANLDAQRAFQHCEEQHVERSEVEPRLQADEEAYQREAVLADERGKAITTLNGVLHRKNLELDALHFVWCDGGCESGVHRFDHGKLTEAIVVEAERNTKRLRTWWTNAVFKAKRHGLCHEGCAAGRCTHAGPCPTPNCVCPFRVGQSA